MKIRNAVIIGDSYSTYEGYIPQGYAPYYTPRAAERSMDVTSVELTWWYKLSTELGFNISENNSWSGSTVSYTGREGDCSETSSFIYRARQLIESGFFVKNQVDTIFIFGATNDSWIDVPLGELKFSEIKKEELYSVIPAISYLAELLKNALPDANIIYILNDGLKTEINEAVRAVCEHYGIGLVELSSIDKGEEHPTALGMEEIKNQIREFILNH